jgi:CRP/FNR family transcriptional regulator, cyclic AMP receptor protein
MERVRRNGRAERAAAVLIFDEDPDLGRGLDSDVLAAARQRIVAKAISLPVGPWAADEPLPQPPPRLGFLLLDGFLTHAVTLADRAGLELVGPGDVIFPWERHGPLASVPFEEAWTIVEPARVALLDQQIEQVFARLPGVMAELVDRASRRGRSLALQGALARLPSLRTRLLVLLWQVADLWGRSGPNGIVIPFRLRHAMLGDLVGARRSSVTLALGDLVSAGVLSRLGRGWWHLHGDPPRDLLGSWALGSATSHAQDTTRVDLVPASNQPTNGLTCSSQSHRVDAIHHREIAPTGGAQREASRL